MAGLCFLCLHFRSRRFETPCSSLPPGVAVATLDDAGYARRNAAYVFALRPAYEASLAASTSPAAAAASSGLGGWSHASVAALHAEGLMQLKPWALWSSPSGQDAGPGSHSGRDAAVDADTVGAKYITNQL